MGAISALGHEPFKVWQEYLKPDSAIVYETGLESYCAKLPIATEEVLEDLRQENKYYSKVDRSVLLAILAARQAVAAAGWSAKDCFGINMGSSRGATATFEKYFSNFQNHPQQQAEILSSPLTTLGNIATWVAHDLEAEGPSISHSITCSSALHALLNGVAWLKSGLVDKFLLGGSEAPLTKFTIAQMKALKILCKSEQKNPYPCRAFDLNKTQNTMVLGEGAATFCLSINPKKPLAYITGIGYGTETFAHPTQISPNGAGLQKAMSMALQNIPRTSIDVVILHAPGTVQGDRSEMAAIQAVFGTNIPKLTTNKWKIGHTLGASAALSIELGLGMLRNNRFVGIPFVSSTQKENGKNIHRLMINAIGFGGNAVSVVLDKP